MLLEYIIAFVPGISIGSSIALSYFAKLIWDAYRRYNLFTLKLKLIQIISGIISIMANCFALFVKNVFFALLLYGLGLILVVFILDLEAIFLNLLRRDKASRALITVLSVLTTLKVLALIVRPFEIIKVDSLLIRKAHLYPGSMTISVLLILMVWLELVILLKTMPKYSWRRKAAIKLFMLYSFVLLFPGLFIVGTWNEFIQISLPYLEALNASLMFFIIVYMYIDNPQYLHLLPVDLYGLALLTYNGISIYEKCLNVEYERALGVAKSIMFSLLTMDQPRGKEASGLLRFFEFSRFKIILYISYFVTGVFISNISNVVLHNILKNITNEYEQIINYPGDSLLSDEEKEIAEKIIGKYLKLLI